MAERVQPSDIAVRAVLLAAAGILAALAVILVGMAVLLPEATRRPAAKPSQFPAPSVLTDERAQRLQLEAAQRARLAGENGAMSIERAMSIIAGRGARAYDPVTEMKP
jgi:hypothetical protein